MTIHNFLAAIGFLTATVGSGLLLGEAMSRLYAFYKKIQRAFSDIANLKESGNIHYKIHDQLHDLIIRLQIEKADRKVK